MTTNNLSKPIPLLLEAIEIPDSAYEKAEARYRDIGEWFCRWESPCRKYNPSIFLQGSFLLGTVTRPSNVNGEFDLDLAVELQRGISKSSHTQKELKTLIGDELVAYRKVRQIKQLLSEKRRCWRLLYKDQMSFHIDALPCIPEDEQRRGMIKEAMMARNADEVLADKVARLTVSITDRERPDYATHCYNWDVSNPQGYGVWFASRARLAKETVHNRFQTGKWASIEAIPAYILKAPLQHCVQLLKVHRDFMFKHDPDRQPISIIITTLAARAYRGQEDVTRALFHILDNMDRYVHNGTPRVPNPVNPAEDFADKWDSPEGRKLGLQDNFYLWLTQAKRDFSRLARTRDADGLAKLAEASLGISRDRMHVRGRLGGSAASVGTPAVTTQRIENPPKPWASR